MLGQFHSEQAAMSDTDRSAMAKVLLLNDDETTMEFVVQVLEDIFGKTRYQALKLMLKIHRDGSGECGVYTVEQASTIVARVAELAGRNGYPLRCITESHSRA
jgi:ATP-dependent Clp protease adaptor protein ClpS